MSLIALQPADVQLGVVNIRSDDDLSPEDVLAQMTPQEAAKVMTMKEDGQIYEALASSLAPGVFGHLDVKKAVLLMLLGGVHKQTAEVSHLASVLRLTSMRDLRHLMSNFRCGGIGSDQHHHHICLRVMTHQCCSLHTLRFLHLQ